MRLILSFFLLLILGCSNQPRYPEPENVDDKVVIDINHLEEKRPVFYSYHFNRKRINFFVIKINGRVMSFLDACRECYPEKLGFGFDNGQIYCRSCNVRYPVESIEKGFGSCYPIKVEGKGDGLKYYIQLKTLQAGADKF